LTVGINATAKPKPIAQNQFRSRAIFNPSLNANTRNPNWNGGVMEGWKVGFETYEAAVHSHYSHIPPIPVIVVAATNIRQEEISKK
jgi:hypothetical protein